MATKRLLDRKFSDLDPLHKGLLIGVPIGIVFFLLIFFLVLTPGVPDVGISSYSEDTLPSEDTGVLVVTDTSTNVTNTNDTLTVATSMISWMIWFIPAFMIISIVVRTFIKQK